MSRYCINKLINYTHSPFVVCLIYKDWIGDPGLKVHFFDESYF